MNQPQRRRNEYEKACFVLTVVLAIATTVIWWDGFSASAGAVAALAQQPVVIDFENVPPGPLSNQFANLGVTFNNMTVVTYSHLPGFAHSGVKAAEQCFAQDSNGNGSSDENRAAD